MNRNLANSMSALAATAAVLVVALMVAVPTGSTADADDQILASVVATDPVVHRSADKFTPSGASAGDSGQLMRTFAMPYFSFVPRG
ncbi:MAG: hypothetical protein ABIO84_03415 [Lysobacter sp.]